MLRERRYRDGVVVPIPPEGAPETPPVPVDPMSDPGIDAVETHGETAFRKEGTDDDETHGEQGADAEGHEADGERGRARRRRRAAGRPPLLEFAAPAAQSSAPALDAYSLRLVSGRELYDCGTLVQHSPALAPLARPARLRVNPYDLNRLGVATGGRVRLTLGSHQHGRRGRGGRRRSPRIGGAGVQRPRPVRRRPHRRHRAVTDIRIETVS